MRTLLPLLLALGLPAMAEELKILPDENVCIEYISTGMMSGTSLQCFTNYGNESYSIEDTVIEIAGIKQETKTVTITKGADIYAVDMETMTATKTKNPVYDQIMANAGDDPQAFGKQFMASMGFNETTEKMDIANTTCTVYVGGFGKMCNTEEGYNLFSSVMGQDKTATRVAIGEAPPDDLLNLLDKVEIVEGPAMPEGFSLGGDAGTIPEGLPEDMMKMLKDLGLQAQ